MLPITEVISISVSQSPTGLSAYCINNLALFTSDTAPAVWGTASYGVYVSPSAVGSDFGTASSTYLLATSVFSQQPNILAGSGQLIVFPNVSNLKTSIDATVDSIFYCGIISNAYGTAASWATLALDVQGYGDKILFLPSVSTADIAGAFTTIKTASDYATRCLYYGGTAAQANAFAAAYASRLLSVNFTGSNTAITMNLKNLTSVTPDETVTETIYNNLATAGVDAYVDYAGVSAVVSNGANKFTDEVYNLVWFVSALKVAGFNALAQVGNKIPQTEAGMSVLRGVYKSICQQAVNNGYIAPGTWTSPEWFGNQADFASNITQYGYYIYSAPVSLQSVVDRAARKAPLVQIAIKEAGACHTSNVVIDVNP